MTIKKIALATLAISLSAVFAADASIISGERDGLSWQAKNNIIGTTDGGTIGNPIDAIGNPIYHPSYPEFGGVVGLRMTYETGSFVCSGTLMEDRRSILTAAHCVSGGAGTANPLRTEVFFQPDGGLDPDETIYLRPPGVVTLDVTDYFVNDNYTGEVIDQNDIAVLRMNDFAPSWAPSYGVYANNDLTGLEFNAAGYGGLGSGNTGVIGGLGYLRQGDNMYDYAWGNSAFGGFFTDIIGGFTFFGTADIEFSYVSDFDNGLAANDQAGRLARAFGTTLFDDVGLGEREVGVAGGDSGGPNFINGLISGVNSYGLSFGLDFGDIDDSLNSSFGEFSGYVPTYIHADFINRALYVSAPGVFVLMGLGLFAVGATSRVRRKA